jgi:succinate-semialdehyde dehydrogenase/glutarate-semialdehyde dehydrogenase
MITTINPSDGSTLAVYEAMTPAQLEQSVRRTGY